MKRYKFLATVAAVILGIAGLAVAQEGYYGQPAVNQSAAPRAVSGAPLVACACGHLHGDMPAMHHFAPAPPNSSKQERFRNNKQSPKNGGASTQQEGDANAPQNHVEYGGA